MKIDALTTRSNWQKSAMANNQADFNNWLEPEKHITGDEYYQQHLNQLQQSDLHFDAKDIQERSPKQVFLNEEENAFNTPERIVITNAITNQSNEDQILIKKMHSTQNVNASLLAELEQSLNELQSISAFENTQRVQPIAKDKLLNTSKTEAFNVQSHYKNFHLFIIGEQAELTLNLHHLNKKEQQELIQLIQEHLKKKGLYLNRIIINGVNND